MTRPNPETELSAAREQIKQQRARMVDRNYFEKQSELKDILIDKLRDEKADLYVENVELRAEVNELRSSYASAVEAANDSEARENILKKEIKTMKTAAA